MQNLSNFLTVQKLASNTVFDFTKNKKQEEFFNAVMMAIAGKSMDRYFFYGGAIRGGKTSVCLTILFLLARKYNNSRWHIIRDSFTTLDATTIPSFEKFYPSGLRSIKKYNRDKANYYVELTNGSRIFFSSENAVRDPDLTWMLGLETNGIFLEQVESLTEKSWSKSLERVGSWYIDPMPPGIVLSTFNPTLGWIKEKIYDKWAKGELETPYYYTNALPTDNPLVTDDQWRGWDQLDSLSYDRFIKGDWTAFGVDKPFFYKFDQNKHIIPSYEQNPHLPLIVSFDFNKDPMTCTISQSLNVRHLRIFDQIEMPNGSTPELCDEIIAKYPKQIQQIEITGDATGRNRSPLIQGNINHYIIIKDKFELLDSQIKVRTSNISHKNSRVLCASVMQNADFGVTENCKDVVADLIHTEVDDTGEIIKTVKQGRHFADNVRYTIDAVFPDFISRPHLYDL
jgi:phage terminase large subunit